MSTTSTRTRITAAAIAVAAALTLTVAGCAAPGDTAAAAAQPAAVTVTAPAPAPVTVTNDVMPSGITDALDAGDEVVARFHEVADLEAEFLQATSDDDPIAQSAANDKMEVLVPKVLAAFADWDSASASLRAEGS